MKMHSLGECHSPNECIKNRHYDTCGLNIVTIWHYIYSYFCKSDLIFQME
jgi:hypothetical protein